MVRCVFAIFLGMAALLPRTAQSPRKTEVFPSVSISLPPSIPSETVQISYFLRGPSEGMEVMRRSGLVCTPIRFPH